MRIKINEENFPDKNFRYVLIEEYGDSVETDTVKVLYARFRYIKSLKGIEYFTDLEVLYCDNNDITELLLEGCVKLQFLECHFNKFKVLPLGNLFELSDLRVDDTLKETLDISKCINLMIENVKFEKSKKI